MSDKEYTPISDRMHDQAFIINPNFVNKEPPVVSTKAIRADIEAHIHQALQRVTDTTILECKLFWTMQAYGLAKIESSHATKLSIVKVLQSLPRASVWANKAGCTVTEEINLDWRAWR